MRDSELRRTVDAARRARGQLDRDKRLIDAAMKEEWNAEQARQVLSVVTQVLDQVHQPVGLLSGIDGIGVGLKLLAQALSDFFEALPPNWSGALSIDQAVDLANAGFPVVWVPPSEILAQLGAASDRPGRIAVLQDNRAELHADALRVLGEATARELAGQ